ncbi:MAG: Hpt domain-containing protein [Gammaproteobacteria bacterium]
MVKETVAGTEVPIVDYSALAQHYEGRHAFIDKLLKLAVEEHRNTEGFILGAVERRDFTALRIIAHTLKGMSGNIMAWRVRDIASNVEHKAAEKNETVFAEAERLTGALAELIAVLERGETGG